jgi:hypothetical protein
MTKTRYPSLRTFSLVLISLMIASTAWCKTINPDIRPGKGVTEQRKLSDYFSALKGTNLDTYVFVLDSGQPGANGLALGGTHGNELAGTVAALIMVENAVVTSGKLIVIPYANRSALSMKDTRKRISQEHPIQSRSGERVLPYGDRRTDLKDQGMDDPEEYKNPAGYVLKQGKESRNLNRTYPGNPEGSPTEQLGYAIMNLLRQEDIDFSLDMHEANTPERQSKDDGNYSPGGNKRLSYTLISHPRGLEMGAWALLSMEEDTGISMRLDESNPAYRGLSHLEFGTATKCWSYLSESPNPGQDSWRSNPDVINDPKYPLKHRAGLHMRLFKNLADAFADYNGKTLTIEGLPEYQKLMDGDIGQFLN